LKAQKVTHDLFEHKRHRKKLLGGVLSCLQAEESSCGSENEFESKQEKALFSDLGIERP